MPFMIDAKYGMTEEEAIVASKAFKPFNVLWFEEAIIPDNYAAYGCIASKTGMPLAMGENLHS